MTQTDRNFDDLAERFARRIYCGLKGRVRLQVIDRELDAIVKRLVAQDLLDETTANDNACKPLAIIDIGCGLAQHAIRLAGQGHEVYANAVSTKLLQQARAKAEGLENLHWIEGNFQALQFKHASVDLLMCHALLEWLAKPALVFSYAGKWLRAGGVLSLSFYNPAAKEYRNLIRGNFDWLENQQDYRSDDGSLTPNNPCSYEQVVEWADRYGFTVLNCVGIRVFSDYVVEQRGGLSNEDQTLKMELMYSQREPFKWLGRYLHVSLIKTNG